LKTTISTGTHIKSISRKHTSICNTVCIWDEEESVKIVSLTSECVTVCMDAMTEINIARKW